MFMAFASATDVSVLPVEGRMAKSKRPNMENVLVTRPELYQLPFPTVKAWRYYKFLYVLSRTVVLTYWQFLKIGAVLRGF